MKNPVKRCLSRLFRSFRNRERFVNDWEVILAFEDYVESLGFVKRELSHPNPNLSYWQLNVRGEEYVVIASIAVSGFLKLGYAQIDAFSERYFKNKDGELDCSTRDLICGRVVTCLKDIEDSFEKSVRFHKQIYQHLNKLNIKQVLV